MISAPASSRAVARRWDDSSVLYTWVAYTTVKAIFIELPAFAHYRDDYLDEVSLRRLQNALMASPEAGDLIEGTGGLRKLRFGDPRRSKGKRGGLRVIYYYWRPGPEFWLFTLYDKDEASDLTASQKAWLRELVKIELEARRVL